LEDFKKQNQFSRVIDTLSPEWKAAVEAMNPEEIVARFIGMRFPEIFSEEKIQSKSFFQNVREEEPRRGQSERREGGGYPRRGGFSKQGGRRGPSRERSRR
jgi:hypothetical protein